MGDNDTVGTFGEFNKSDDGSAKNQETDKQKGPVENLPVVGNSSDHWTSLADHPQKLDFCDDEKAKEHQLHRKTT